MAPVVLSVLLLGTMVSLQTFEVEQVLGCRFDSSCSARWSTTSS